MNLLHSLGISTAIAESVEDTNAHALLSALSPNGLSHEMLFCGSQNIIIHCGWWLPFVSSAWKRMVEE